MVSPYERAVSDFRMLSLRLRGATLTLAEGAELVRLADRLRAQILECVVDDHPATRATDPATSSDDAEALRGLELDDP